jgi:diguanylate cyclase (GGDEF)-like protein/PAS domain S-box-containing protein
MKDRLRKEAELSQWRQRRIVDLEKKAALEKKIGELNARLAAIVSYCNEAIIGKDLHGTVTSWNKAAERIYGYTAEEMIGRPISILVPPGRPDEIPLILERIKRHKSVEHFETVRMGKDGKRVYVSLTVSPIVSAGGKIIGASTIARDITRRKKAEEMVRRQAHILNQIHDAVITTDLDGYVTDWNKGAEKMFSYTSDEVLGRHISFIYPEEDRDFLRQEVIRPLKEKGEHEGEVRLMRKSGEKFHALLMLTLLRDGNDVVIGMVGSSVDITLLKKAEERIRLDKEEWEQTFDAMPDIVAVIDHNNVIRLANKALAKRLGINRDELIGERCYSAICGVKKPSSNCPGIRAVASGKEHREERFLKKLQRPYLISCTPISVCDGAVTSFVEICRDISEQKKLEEKLRESAIKDILTGLFNRKGFFTLAEKQLKLAERNKRNMIVLFLDLDNMKEINDRFGHKEGDEALIETASFLRRTFRESDIIARMGGDEFAVLVTEPSGREVEKVIVKHLQYSLRDLNEELRRSGRAYRLSFSVGSAYYDPKRPCTVGDILAVADEKMYQEKKKRRRKRKDSGD